MTTTARRYHSDFAHRYYSQGEAQGEAKSLLLYLDARGVEVPDSVRTRITECTDVEQLELWIRRAATVNKIQDVDDSFIG